jgi:threonyl-tRNA synthetase
MQKVPYILVVGDKEKANGAVAVRARGNQDLGVMPLADFSEKLARRHRPRSELRRRALSFLAGPSCLRVAYRS